MKKKGKENLKDNNEKIKSKVIEKEKSLSERKALIPELEIVKIETRIRNSIQELISPVLVRLDFLEKNLNEGASSVNLIAKKYTSIMFTIQKFKQTKMIFDDFNKRLENLVFNKQENFKIVYEPRREDDLNKIKEKFKEINLKLENLEQNVSSLVLIIIRSNEKMYLMRI